MDTISKRRQLGEKIMKVVITGSRTITDKNYVFSVMDKCPYEITEFISGHANGVDKLGEDWAQSKGIPIKLFIPHYSIDNPRIAPLLRNTDMSLYADSCIAIWDGNSKGTRHMIGEMIKAKKPCHVVVDGKVRVSAVVGDWVW
jgi:hypothetical protein